MGSNPNATVAAVAGAFTVVIVWIVGMFNVDVPPEVSSAVTTLIIGGILFIGKRTTKAAPPPPPR